VAVAAIGASIWAASAVATSSASGKINACVNKKTGAVRIAGKSSKCRSGERKLSWNAAGARGAAGAPGSRGPTGAGGPPGARGPTGMAGAPGAKGATGARGITGRRGATGPGGGATGPKGATGAKGATSARGPTGPYFFVENESSSMSSNLSSTAGTTEYISLVAPSAPSTTTTNGQATANIGATLSKLGVTLDTPAGSGKSRAITIMIDGVESALTCITSNGQKTCSDTTHAVAVSSGSKINVKITNVGGAAAAAATVTATYATGRAIS
jgi:collagen type I alpha